MPMISSTALDELKALLGADRVDVDEASVWKKAHDFYWFSPRMESAFETLSADAAVAVRTLDELKSVVSWAVRHTVPLNPRGAATSNFGQVVPLHRGLMVDVSGLNKILEWGEDWVRAQPGVRCQTIENAARDRGLEMMNYPSTWVKGTIGGFVSAGSGGIGGMRFGYMHHNRMVVEVSLLTIEESPRVVKWVGGEECLTILHTFGTVGIVVEVSLKLAPSKDWDQVIVTSPDLDALFGWAVELVRDESLSMRTMCFLEVPQPMFCKPFAKWFQDDEHALLIEVENVDTARLQGRAEALGFRVPVEIAAHHPRKAPMLSDFVQGHAMLWAKKADKRLASCAVKMDPDNWREQRRRICSRFHENPFFMSVDFHRWQGEIILQSAFRYVYDSDEGLQERLDFVDSLGLTLFNTHEPQIESKFHKDQIAKKIRLKTEFDPHGILNPGKLGSHPINPFTPASAVS